MRRAGGEGEGGRDGGEGVEARAADFGATVLNADAGGVVAFPGKLRHGGSVVTAGRRYIIPLFIYAAQNRNARSRAEGREPGYVLRHLGVAEPDAAASLSRYASKVIEERAAAAPA